MKIKKCFWFIFFIVFNYSFTAQGCSDNKTNEDAKIKKSEFDGQFYPADKIKLTNALSLFFDNASAPKNLKPSAIIVPHAGYIYSGQIAADAYNQAKQFNYNLIVILGTNHTTAGFSGISVYDEDYYETPLGTVKIDKDFISGLRRAFPAVEVNSAVNKKEHSIEVQIPFIQYAFPKTEIVPIIVGSPDILQCSSFGKTLAGLLKTKNALIVASSDLSHYTDFKNAVSTDKKTLSAFVNMNLEDISNSLEAEMHKGIPALVTCACGLAPVLTAVSAVTEMGIKKGDVISYANSGNSSLGNVEKVVGYGAVVFCKTDSASENNIDSVFNLVNQNPENREVIPLQDKEYLLKFARQTVEEYLRSEITPLARNIPPSLFIKRGAFVTLKKNNELRGCIGNMGAQFPLYKIIGNMAFEAAFNDGRFAKVELNELKQIEFEISILTPFKKIANADLISLGKDGVLINKYGKHAVFLPQVATETGWTKEQFLDQLCYKAGLAKGDWKEAELFIFQADVFKESDFKPLNNSVK